MRKKHLFLLLMAIMLPFTSMQLNAAQVNLQVGYDDPTTDQESPQRGPVLVPEVSLDDYTLTFSTPCYGYTLELLDSDGEMVYTTIINSTGSSCSNLSRAVAAACGQYSFRNA